MLVFSDEVIPRHTDVCHGTLVAEHCSTQGFSNYGSWPPDPTGGKM